MAISEEQLRRADQEWRATQRLADEARERRNELARQALAGGWRVDALAEVLGVTKGRVSQIRTDGDARRRGP